MANFITPKIITTEVHSTFGYYFELDAEKGKINVKVYDRDADKNMIPNAVRETGWMGLTDENGNPNLPVDKWSLFAQALPLVTELVIAYGKQGGIVDPDAQVVLE